MPRRFLATTLAALAVVLCLSPAVARAATGAVPASLPLSAGWQRLPDPANTGVGRGLWKPGDQGPWRPAAVPGVIAGDTPEAGFRGTVAWYRVTFTAPKASRFAWDLRFEQVRRSAQVWLNGQRLGRNDDPYVPFDLRTAGALKPGGRNVLVVRVDNRKDGSIREGWWNWGGITRPVSLVPRGGLVLQDAAVLSDVRCEPGASGTGDGCTARARFDGYLVNRGSTPVPRPQVRLTLGSGRALTVGTTARALAPGEQTRVRMVLPVPEPRLWSPEKPQLYDVTVTTSAGDVVQQVDRWRTGLRDVRVRDGMLVLNGKQLTLRGASVQEDVPGRGPALRDADIARIVADLKAVNANVTRAHYLLHPKLLAALDAAGIMVWSQSPIYHRDVLLRRPEQRETALATVRRTILESRNHPSVITHSVANELSPVPDETPGTAAFLDAARAVAREADPTLPASVDLLSYPGYDRQETYARFPLLGINSYFGWYKGKKEHSVERLEDLGPFLDRMRVQYPTQALQITEFGAESTYDGPVSEKETYAFQTRYLEQVLRIIEDRPFIGGAIYWTLREFAVKPNWVGGHERPVARDSIHNKGLITYAGTKKPAWDVAARAFADTPSYRQVSQAAAAGVQGAEEDAGSALAVAIALGVIGLLVVDGWAIAGIWGRSRRGAGRGAGARAGAPADGGQEPAGARAA